MSFWKFLIERSEQYEPKVTYLLPKCFTEAHSKNENTNRKKNSEKGTPVFIFLEIIF